MKAVMSLSMTDMSPQRILEHSGDADGHSFSKTGDKANDMASVLRTV